MSRKSLVIGPSYRPKNCSAAFMRYRNRRGRISRESLWMTGRLARRLKEYGVKPIVAHLAEVRALRCERA